MLDQTGVGLVVSETTYQWQRIAGAGHLRKCPPGPQSKIPVVKKGKMTFLTNRGKMTPLTPGTLDWGHLHRHSAPRNPPPLLPTAERVP